MRAEAEAEAGSRGEGHVALTRVGRVRTAEQVRRQGGVGVATAPGGGTGQLVAPEEACFMKG